MIFWRELHSELRKDLVSCGKIRLNLVVAKCVRIQIPGSRWCKEPEACWSLWAPTGPVWAQKDQQASGSACNAISALGLCWLFSCTTCTQSNQQWRIVLYCFSSSLGKPHVRILGVQPEFCRKGGGVETPCRMGCGNSSVNINHYWGT